MYRRVASPFTRGDEEVIAGYLGAGATKLAQVSVSCGGRGETPQAKRKGRNVRPNLTTL